jgi:hypothetical protein
MTQQYAPYESLPFIQGSKPFDVLIPLIDKLIKNKKQTILNRSRNTRLNFIQESYVVVVLEGDFEIRRKDDLTIIKGSGPYVLGLVEGMVPRMLNYIYAITQLKGVIIPVENAMEIIDHNQLWENVATLIAWQLQLFSARDQEVTSVDARTMIKAKIIELYTLEESNGSHLNVVDYVQQRTKLGKSIIYLVLSELKNDNLVGIDRGKLTMLNPLLLENNVH